MKAFDGLDSGWVQKGAWTVPVIPAAPVSVTPSSGTGSNQTFSFVYSAPQGFATIYSASMIVNNTPAGAGGCYVYIFVAAIFCIWP